MSRPGRGDLPVGMDEKMADEDVGAPRGDTPKGDAPRGEPLMVGVPRGESHLSGIPRGGTPMNGDLRSEAPVDGAPMDRAPSDGGRREWYSRGYLPHRDSPYLIQSVTYRLGDSLPQAKLDALQLELDLLPEQDRDLESRRRMEHWLDAGMGCCALRNPEVARYVQDSFLHFHGTKYDLHAWCIMPNHVHVIVEPFTDLASLIQGWKSYTARWILQQNTRLGLRIPEDDRVWMREYWDRYIRDPVHYQKAVDYVHRNPVSAGLCLSPED